MNHIYRVVYNHHTNTYQAVPEISKGTHKTHSECNQDGTFTQSSLGNVPFSRTALTVLAAIVMTLGAQRAHAAPLGGQVSAGQATIQQNGKVTDIHQTSQKAAINWQKFGIKADETVNFKQPNAQSVTLNRVIGNEKSVIDGAMKANGKVFITNPNGVMIGNGAKINVGALLATTGKISDSDFMAGNYRFQDAKGAVENYGEITVPEGGAVALIAPVVRNQGTIKTPQGNALLASAEQFSVTLQDDNFAYTLDKGTLQGLVDNGGAIYADAGHIVLTAKGVDMVKKSLIKHSGIAEANTVQNKNGVIELLGDLDNTRLEVSGSLKAEAKENSDGGFIETSASQLDISEQANISTHAENGKTGTWLIDPKDFTVAPSGGDTTGAVVSKGLEQNNVTLKSRDGAKEGKGDVVINDEISWNKNILTLNAENDIHINKTLNGSGTAKLALEYGQGTANGGDSDYHLQKDTPLKDRTVKINLPEGQTFSTQKGSQGTTNEFTVIHKMPDITKNANGDWVSGFTTQNIAIGKDIDIGYTKNYENFTGYTAKNNTKIHGLGHKIDNLNLNLDLNLETLRANGGVYAGLITQLNDSEIRNLGVTNFNIIDNNKVQNHYTDYTIIGGLTASSNNSIVQDSYTTGKATISNAGLGGMLGSVTDSVIKNNYANIIINQNEIVNNSAINIGGLIGYSHNSNISNSYTDGSINLKRSHSGIGGLIGKTGNDTIKNSHSNVDLDISNGIYVGGLLGESENSRIGHSYATGNIVVSNDVRDTGGLIGASISSNVIDNYATGNISYGAETYAVGGLIGHTHNTTVSNNYATGNLKSINDKFNNTSYRFVGGLIGETTNSTINNNNASGDIQATNVSYVGGLIGQARNYKQLQKNYATGNISASHYSDLNVGGLSGRLDGVADAVFADNYATGDIYVTHSAIENSRIHNNISVGGLSGSISAKKSINNFANNSISVTFDYDNLGSIVMIGGLFGSSSTELSNSSASSKIYIESNGNIDSTKDTWGSSMHVGGLSGKFSGKIIDSNAQSDIQVKNLSDPISLDSHIGGLSGTTGNSEVQNSTSKTNFDINHMPSTLGGLIGSGSANINKGYAINNIKIDFLPSKKLSSDIEFSYIGGLLGDEGDYSGYSGKGSISNSSANSNVNISKPENSKVLYFGGLAGEVSKITTSSAVSNLNISTDTNLGHLGGLAGNVYENIDNSYAKIDLDLKINNKNNNLSMYLGGVAGNSHGNITNTYADGNFNIIDNTIKPDINDTAVGGIAGMSYGKIKNSYSLVDMKNVPQFYYRGGVLGSLPYYVNTWGITNSHYDTQKVGVNNLVGTPDYEKYRDKGVIDTRSSGKTTEEMKQKSTFKDWDFDTVWRIDEGNDYPRLRALTEGTIIVTPTPPTANKTDVGVQAHDLKKVYDGKEVSTEEHLRTIATTNGYSDIVSVSGLKDGDTLSSLGGLTYGGTWQGAKNAGKYSIVPSGLNGGQKYEIKYGEGSLTIDKRPIAISGSRQYDGTYNAYGSVDTKKLKENLVGDDANQVGDSDIIIVSNAGKLAEKDASEQKVKMTEKAQPVFVTNATNSMSVMQNYDVDTANSDWLINKKDLTITAMNNIKPEGENNPDPSRIGVLIDGLVKGEKISDVGLSYSDDKKWQGEISIIRVGEPTFTVGKASNYEITKQDGKLLTVQKDYDVKNITDKNPEEIAEYRDLLNSVEDEMLLAHAVYGSDTAKKGDNDRWYEIWEVKDKDSDIVVKELKPLGFKDKIPNDGKTYTKLYELIKDESFDYSDGVRYQITIKKDWAIDDTKIVTQAEYDELLKTTPKDNITINKTFRDGLYSATEPNGLNVGVYQKVGTDKKFIVFRGTDTGHAVQYNAIWSDEVDSDGGTNVNQVRGNLPKQYEKAKEITKNLISQQPNKEWGIIGHSLGGGLATYSSIHQDKLIRTVVFNQAQIQHKNLPEKYKNMWEKFFNERNKNWTQNDNATAQSEASNLTTSEMMKYYTNIGSFVVDNDALSKAKLSTTLYPSGFFPINFLGNTDISKIGLGSEQDHLMPHVIKTQQLADMMAKNNEILANCQSSDCQVLRQNRWTPSSSNLEKIDNKRVNTINKLTNEQNQVHQQISELERQGKNSEIKQRDLDKINQKLEKATQAEVTSSGITVIRDNDTFSVKKNNGWQFKKGDIINTGNKKAKIYFPDGSWVELDKNTSIEITIEYNPNIQLDKSIASYISLLKGKILKEGTKK